MTQQKSFTSTYVRLYNKLLRGYYPDQPDHSVIPEQPSLHTFAHIHSMFQAEGSKKERQSDYPTRWTLSIGAIMFRRTGNFCLERLLQKALQIWQSYWLQLSQLHSAQQCLLARL